MVFPLNVVADEQHAKVRTADTSFSDRHAAHVKDASQAGSVYRLGRPFLKLRDAGDPAVSYSAFASRRAGGPPSALNGVEGKLHLSVRCSASSARLSGRYPFTRAKRSANPPA